MILICSKRLPAIKRHRQKRQRHILVVVAINWHFTIRISPRCYEYKLITVQCIRAEVGAECWYSGMSVVYFQCAILDNACTIYMVWAENWWFDEPGNAANLCCMPQCTIVYSLDHSKSFFSWYTLYVASYSRLFKVAQSYSAFHCNCVRWILKSHSVYRLYRDIQRYCSTSERRREVGAAPSLYLTNL